MKKTIHSIETKYLINNCTKSIEEKIHNIDINLERLRRCLSLLTWMFDCVMTFPNTLDSEVISIYNNNSIKNLRELIYSDIIVEKCRNYILDKYNLLNK